MTKNLKKLWNAVEGFKSSGGPSPGKEFFVEEAISADQFSLGKIVRHGFPHEPTCIAFDPIQRLLAIGTKYGAIRVIGRPGADCHLQHTSDSKVLAIEFLVNEGALLCVCSDDTVNLWRFTDRNASQTKPQSLQFKRERLNTCRLSVASKWLYLGTDKGNVHFVKTDDLQLSGYTIQWNKAMDLCQKSHPGAIIQLDENPLDPNKLLIGYETGLIVVWDLKTKKSESRFNANVTLSGLSWHFEGRLFLSSHIDGSLMTWNIQRPQKPQSCIYPHATANNPNEKGPFGKIKKVQWLSLRTEGPLFVFAGGVTLATSGLGPTDAPMSLTVMREKRLFVLQMDHPIVDFVPLCQSPYKCESEEPYAVACLLQSDLVVIDLTSQNFPLFDNPYPMDIHESSVTCCNYLADCPPDLIPAFYSIGRSSNKSGEIFSTKEWPIKGGNWGENSFSYSELIITGHADGSIKFWDASQMSLQVLLKVRTSKFFERAGACHGPPPPTPAAPPSNQRGDDSETASRASDSLNANVLHLRDDTPFAINLLHFCPESRKLLAAGSTHVCVLAFAKREVTAEVVVLDVGIQYEVGGALDDGGVYCGEDTISSRDSSARPSPGAAAGLPHQSGSVGSYSSNTSEREVRVCIGVKAGQRRWPAGYQPDMICRLGCLESGEPPPPITSVCLNSFMQLMAFGNECGVVVVDIVQKTVVVSYGTPDLYGSLDPYNRVPRSPGMKKEDPKSPTIEKMNGLCLNSSLPSGIGSRGGDRGGATAAAAAIVGGTAGSASGLDLRSSASVGSMAAAGGSSGGGGGPVGVAAASMGTTLASPVTRTAMAFKGELRRAKSQDKQESHFSRSCSSSTSSLDNLTISREPIKCMQFAEAFTKKGEVSQCYPSLWIGTSLGSVLVLNLLISSSRASQPVTVVSSGSIFRLHGEIMAIGFLDGNGELVPPPSERWEDQSRSGDDCGRSERQQGSIRLSHQVTRSGNSASSNTLSSMGRQNTTSSLSSSSPSPGFDSGASSSDRQMVVMVSEAQARVVALPSQTCLYKKKFTDKSYVIRADILRFKEQVPVLANYMANGRVTVFSLPSLRVLIDVDCVALTERVARTLCFSQCGQGVYFSTPSEMEKMTLSSAMCEQLPLMQPEMFKAGVEMPEAPKRSFFQSLFGGGQVDFDRDELFGGSDAGKPAYGTAQAVSNTRMNQLSGQASGAMGEVARTRQALLERGERISELDKMTQEMTDASQVYSRNARLLAIKKEKESRRWLPF